MLLGVGAVGALAGSIGLLFRCKFRDAAKLSAVTLGFIVAWPTLVDIVSMIDYPSVTPYDTYLDPKQSVKRL
jgi:hypothetical protein